MAKFRYVNTQIWEDEWFISLDALEQHLFLYFLTNPSTNITGIYQIPLRRMQYDTGMDQEKIKKIIMRLSADGRIFYEQGWVIMKNWHKHQTLNPNQMRAVVTHFNSLPDWLREAVVDPESPMHVPLEALWKGSKGFESLRTNSNSKLLTLTLTTNPNPNGRAGARVMTGQTSIDLTKEDE